ncbi:hypothetical protein IDF54_14640, partial [Flavobacterium sp. SaA2.13]|uniref:hypothetical protein n=1 Tax=Flavobacterium sp. SaA2.13 TaxID=2691898 RepID=UPI00178C444A
ELRRLLCILLCVFRMALFGLCLHLTEIEAEEKQMAELPELVQKIRKEASAALNEEKQLKAKLSALAQTQEADKKLLDN